MKTKSFTPANVGMCVCVCVCVYIYIYIYIYIYMQCVCICVCMHVCKYACMYVCLNTHTHTQTICAHTHTLEPYKRIYTHHHPHTHHASNTNTHESRPSHNITQICVTHLGPVLERKKNTPQSMYTRTHWPCTTVCQHASSTSHVMSLSCIHHYYCSTTDSREE